MKLFILMICVMAMLFQANLLTKQEMETYIEARLEEKRIAVEAEQQNLIVRLAEFCSVRMKEVDEVVESAQRVMQEKLDTSLKYDVFEVPLDIGFCAMVRLNDLSFYSSYRMYNQQLRVRFHPTDSYPHLSYFMINGLEEHPLLLENGEVQRDTIRLFFENQ